MFALALGLRLPQLDRRPMHGDEAVHAVKFGELLATGRYVYDPHEYHGPTLYYLTLPIAWARDARSLADLTEIDLRLLPVLCGVGLLLILPLVVDGLGRAGVLVAGLLTAVSPVLVYFNRYYIQESLLVFFTAVAIAAGWRYAQSRRLRWMILAGAAVGLAHATKETSLIVLAALAAALLLMGIDGARTIPGDASASPVQGPPKAMRILPKMTCREGGALLVGLCCALAASTLLYSSLLSNPRGPIDALRAVAIYADRAGGATHAHPWYFYIQQLLYFHYPGAPVWTQAAILALGIVGVATAWTARRLSRERTNFARFMAVFTLLLAAAYSLIPYKTPWCVLGVMHGLIWLAGCGAAWLWQSLRTAAARALLAGVVAGAAAHLAYQAWQAAVPFGPDHRSPYAYAHPVPDVQRLAAWLNRLAAVHPDGHRMRVHVITSNPWPLPWYLRRFERAGFWEAPTAEPDADVLIVAQEFWSEIEPTLRQQYQTSIYGLRPTESLVAAVAMPLYERFERHPLAKPNPSPAAP